MPGRCPLPIEVFERATATRIQAAGVQRPRDLDGTLAELTAEHLELFNSVTGRRRRRTDRSGSSAVRACSSRDASKARDYRRLHDVP